MDIKVAILMLLAVLIYILPSFVADKRKHPQNGPITIINLFLGWTLIGWVIALAWACSAIGPSQAVGAPVVSGLAIAPVGDVPRPTLAGRFISLIAFGSVAVFVLYIAGLRVNLLALVR